MSGLPGGRGMMHTTVRRASGNEGSKTCHCVWDDCCYFWFHKATWLNFKNLQCLLLRMSDFFVKRISGYPVSFTTQNWLPFFFLFKMGVLSYRFLEVWDPSLYLTFDSLVSPGSKVLLSTLILSERLTWTLSPSASPSLTVWLALPQTFLFHSLRIIFQA